MQSIASSRAGAWLFSRILHHLDRTFLWMTGGRTTLASLVTGLPIVVVATTGAKSGLPRTTPLLCVRDRENPDSFAIVASNWGKRLYPGWYFNLKANPGAVCEIRGESAAYIAHEALGEEYDKYWRQATKAYLGFSMYKQRAGGRRIPIMVMTPVIGPQVAKDD